LLAAVVVQHKEILHTSVLKMALTQHFITRQREQRDRLIPVAELLEVVALMVVVVVQVLEAVAVAAGLLEMALKELGVVTLDLVSLMEAMVDLT
jgi:hypothetical protein